MGENRKVMKSEWKDIRGMERMSFREKIPGLEFIELCREEEREGKKEEDKRKKEKGRKKKTERKKERRKVCLFNPPTCLVITGQR